MLTLTQPRGSGSAALLLIVVVFIFFSPFQSTFVMTSADARKSVDIDKVEMPEVVILIYTKDFGMKPGR